MELLVIPNELLICIRSKLDVPSLLRCAMVCRHIYDTFKTSLDLTCTTKAYIKGVIYAGPLPAALYPERLPYLHRQRCEWMSSKWTKISSVYLMHSGHTYDIAGRVCAQCNGNVLDVVTLPSSSISRKSERTTFNPADDDTNEEVCPEYLGIDPSQDLIVLIEDVDTWASVSLFPQHNFNQEYPDKNILMLQFQSDDGALRAIIWDWTTAELVLVR
ncbi:hypothetical protein BDN70DRAFT_938755 [Pholiota conissans]|uniref:F-box domain-containing protein n=1 Tax=Pholiota conissans TaxID=109636 RepID=A0A9P5YNA1_9AGAR|nr:hypothetical protein BDN70DRAFT_938755 [Pholiota conissans]